MAIDKTGRTWAIPSADASTSTPVWNDRVLIKKLSWLSPQTSGDDVIVKDTEGRVIWQRKAQAVGDGILYTFDVDNWHKGLLAHTIDSGTLYVEIG